VFPQWLRGLNRGDQALLVVIRAHVLGNAKVGDDGALALRAGDQDDVGTLEVPVNDARGVCGAQTRAELPDDGFGLVKAELALAAHALGQRLAGQQLHGEEVDFFRQVLLVAKEVKDAAHVGVGDLARELDLAAEPLHGQVIRGNLRTDGLQRHVLFELLVQHLVDLPMPPAAMNRMTSYRSDSTVPGGNSGPLEGEDAGKLAAAGSGSATGGALALGRRSEWLARLGPTQGPRSLG